jgi:hypothetical protein
MPEGWMSQLTQCRRIYGSEKTNQSAISLLRGTGKTRTVHRLLELLTKGLHRLLEHDLL